MIFDNWFQYLQFCGDEKNTFYNFDGIDDFIRLPEISFPNSFFWEFEIKTTQVGAMQMLVGGSYNLDYYMRLGESSTTVRWWIGSQGDITLTSPVPITDGEFHKLRMGYDGSKWFFNVDGLNGSVSGDAGKVPVTKMSNLFVGARSDLTRFYSGVIRNVNLNNQIIIPIDDGWTESGTIKNNGSGGDAAAVNFNQERWELSGV